MASSMDKLAKELKKQMTASDERKPKPYDTQAEVLRVENGVAWVHIPGGVDETPVRLTINAKKGDNVNLHVANGTAWITGNSTNPPTDDSTANYAVNISNEVKKDVTVLSTVVAENIEATNARFTNVEADTAKIHDLTADNLHATVGYIEDLTADSITANDISAASGYIKDLEADNITAQDISASSGYIKDLTAENIAAQDVIADHATVGSLDANYAQIDMANVNNAWIENGYIKKAEVFDENVFDLSGNRATLSRIDASKINVANLRADNLVVRRINGQPVVGGYTLVDSNSSGYSSKNPKALGWYEFVNAEWVKSQDTTVDMTKAYYQEGNEVSLYDQQYIDSLENDLQQQIDGAVETFTGSVVPTLVNYPYTDWYDTSVTPIHDERAKHVGDIYYVVNSAADENGYCYRFAYDNTNHAYSWVLIKDSDVTKALSDISELQTFESETTSWIDETDEGLETIRTNHTTLAGVVDKTVKESIQLWYTKANTTAPNKPTAEVVSTSTAGNNWRKVVPAWNASYPNYYYCWQYKFVDGTFGWSDVVRDIAMGETQGTARDAKNTADAALPASTFTTFESTTFKNVKDTVDEQTTKFTNMTTRLGLNSDGTGANTDIVAKESALEQTVDGISSRVGKTEMHLAGMYATSSTAAGTAAKVATIVPTLSGYELAKGAMVTVKFTAANTAASPTLNLNGTGAKAIKTYSGGNLTADEYKWKAGSTFTFTYNGTNWLMQDSTASVRMTNAETEIQQTADNVLIKATKSDITAAQGGQHLIQSLINVAPDGVTIDADKVNITGTTVFSDGTSIQSRIDAVDVGGRNLLTGTSESKELTTAVNQNWFNPQPYKLSTYANTAIADASNTQISISFDYSVTGVDTAFNMSASLRTNSSTGTYGAGFKVAEIPVGNSSGHAFGTKDITNAMRQHAPEAGIMISGSGNANANAVVTISNVKLEFGNKATDWSPAPEDVQAEIDAKKSVWTLMTSGTGSTYANILNWTMEGRENTSWGINTTATPIDKIKVGDTVRVAYKVTDMGTADNRPYVYVIGEFERSSGSTVYLTMHGLDTTIIDGGNILTNSIGANQIKANAVKADELDTDSINNSGLLSTGALTVGAKSEVLNSNIKIGGENLLQQFLSGNAPNSYLAYKIPLSENLIVGETYTLQLWGVTFNNTPAGGTVAAYWGGGSIALTGNMAPDSNGYVSNTFTVTQAMEDVAPTTAQHWYINLYNSVPYGNKTARDMTLTGWKLEKGNKPTDWSLSSADTKAGKNLLRCTADMNSGNGSWANGNFRASGGTTSHVTAAGPHPDGINGAIRVTNTGSSAAQIGLCQDSVPNLVTGKLYTLSAWIRASVSNLTVRFQPIWGSSTQTTSGKDVGLTETVWCYYSATLRLTGDARTTYSAGYIYVKNVPANGWFEVCGLKLEEGGIATGWTPGEEADASNYISMDSSGIRIASANPSTQNQRMELTSSEAALYSSDGTKRVSITAGTGVVVGNSGKGHTTINDSGMVITDVNNKKRTQINSGGLHVFDTDGSTDVASFGTTARVGKEASRHIEIGDGGLQVYQDGSTVMAHLGYGSGNAESGTATAPYFVFGMLNGSPTLGNYSVTEGSNSAAVGVSSHAEGGYTQAIGVYSHAEGFDTEANGHRSHAEGQKCYAGGFASHAEGEETVANGAYSHAAGRYTTAGYNCQTVIGVYNQNKSSNMFEIGNGTLSTPKNIFEVDTSGNVNIPSGANYKINGASISSTTRKTFTPTSGASYSGYGGCYYEKYGNVVHVHVGVSGLTANTATNISTLPAGYRPHSMVCAHGTGGSWDNLGYLQISTDGVVMVRSKGTYCGADVTYIV